MNSPTAARRFGQGLLLGTLSAFGPLSMDMYLPALPALQTALGTTTALAQLTITASLVGMAAGQLVIGPLSDRYGRRLPLQAGLWLFILTSLLIAWVPNIWLLLLLRLVQGIGGAAGQVLSRSIARDLYGGTALTKFLALLMAVNGIFPIISPSIGSLVLMATDWQGIFLLLAAIGLLLSLASWRYLPETLPTTARGHSAGAAFKQMASLVANRRFMTYVIAQGFAYGALFSYISGSPFVFQRYYHLPAFAFALVYALIGLGIIVGTALVNRLVSFTGTRHLLFAGLTGGIGTALFLLLNAVTLDSVVVVVIACFGLQVCFAMVNATATSLGMGVDAAKAGGASALLGLGSNAVAGIFSPLVGLFAATNTLPMSGLILVADGLAFATAWLGRRA
ncbi:multidrug effflux MFS transporter [Lacticaseibacillus nasuensis]|nr:multidrug effflux MFS transporter [Lacticaseibacillus nasuensis]